jgi:prepilin-type N-terminal cleavage/methylation domain-containing protein
MKGFIDRDLCRITPAPAAPLRIRARRHFRVAFTLVELLVVIGIIAVLLALTFPAVRAVGNGAKRSQAATDVHRIAAAVASFEVEYGRLPALDTGDRTEPGQDVAVGDRRAGLSIPNRELFYILCAIERGSNLDAAVNSRRVVFFEGPNVKNPDRPAAGFLSSRGGRSSDDVDCFFDPWGRQYCVALDYSGDGKTQVEYVDFTGENTPAVRVAAFSMGADTLMGCHGNFAYRKGGTISDDIISW